MVRYSGISASGKEILLLFGLVIAFILILPYLLKQTIKNTASVASDLVSDAVGSVQPKLDAVALDMMPSGIREVTAITPSLSPSQFPTTPVPANEYMTENYPDLVGIPESQPFVDWLKGSSDPGTAYILTPEQEKAFLDPVGDAQAQERIEQGLKNMEEQKAWWQVW